MILPHNIGTWREAVAVKAEELVAVSRRNRAGAGCDVENQSANRVATAARLRRSRAGDWLIQNAANSAAGRAVIQIAHELGFKTINVVRRAELIDELRAEGGDVVLVDGEKLRDEVKTATDGAPIRLGLNSVGGDSALRLANCLAFGGTLVSFGAMSLQPLKIPTGLSDFQRPAFSRNLDQSLVRQRHHGERMAAFNPLFDMADARSAENKSRKNVFDRSTQKKPWPTRCRTSERQDCFPVCRLTAGVEF